MTKFDLVEHMSNISAHLMSRFKLAKAYGHKGGKGEIREAVLTEWLREFLPDTVCVSKGEIVDSELRRSSEFDLVLYLMSPTPRLFSSQEKRVIPAETVLAIIEVKSNLRKEDIAEFAESIAYLNTFSRYFRPTELNLRLSELTGGKPFPDVNVPLGDSEKGVGAVVGGLFSFEAADPQTVQKYFAEMKAPANFGWVFALGSCFWLHHKGQWLGHPRGTQSIMHFVTCILELCKDSQRWTHAAFQDMCRTTG